MEVKELTDEVFVVIGRDEWYPVWTPSLKDGRKQLGGEYVYGHAAGTIPRELVQRWARVRREFKSVQDELQAVIDSAEAEERKKQVERQLEIDIGFVQKHRPWWSRERAAALVASRDRKGRSVRWVPSF
jgi:hypothetical protein